MIKQTHGTMYKRNISSSTKPVTTKLGSMVTYNQGDSPIMSNDSLTTWSREVTRQIKNKVSPLLQRLWQPNLAGWWFMMREAHASWLTILWLRDHVRSLVNLSSCDKLKMKYLLFSKVYDHQTWLTTIAATYGKGNQPIKWQNVSASYSPAFIENRAVFNVGFLILSFDHLIQWSYCGARSTLVITLQS